MKERLKIGVIGLGSRGFGIVCDPMLPMEDVDIIGVCDLYEDRLKKAADLIEKFYLAVAHPHNELFYKQQNKGDGQHIADHGKQIALPPRHPERHAKRNTSAQLNDREHGDKEGVKIFQHIQKPPPKNVHIIKYYILFFRFLQEYARIVYNFSKISEFPK